ncbi:MAG: tryptophan synthase subunit alpha [Planctomycetes bacterium]|nr:tryptophan synthase subunit alpha [Planctomycetota bacterium]
MTQIEQIFRACRTEGRRLIIPFLTAGDPDLEFTLRLANELSRRGCPIVELGIPYSDPIADGPVIQASYTRALARRITVPAILQALAADAARGPAAAVEPASACGGSGATKPHFVTMVSYAIVHRIGLQEYVTSAQRAGVQGAIVPDLPADEAQALAAICGERDFNLIQLVTPTTPRDRAVRIAETSSGFLYYVSVAGITGERRSLPPGLLENVDWLRQRTPLPICIGFGISTPDHVRTLAPVADGLIVGSAIVRRVEGCDGAGGADPRRARIAEIGDFVGDLIAALP